MPRLDELIDRWIDALGEAEPALTPHLDEIADHVRSDAQARCDAGVDVSDAFAAAILTFGVPRELAQEFLKTPGDERFVLRRTVMYLAASFLVTAMTVAVDKLVVPLDPKWVSFVLLVVVNPLLILLFGTRYRKVLGGRRRV